MSKFLARVFLFTLAVALNIAVMTNGWGLEVKSWGWILGIGYLGQMLIFLTHVILSAELERRDLAKAFKGGKDDSH